MTDQRLEAVEFKLAHLERAVQELSDVMYRQQRELDELRTRHAELLEQVRMLDAGDDDERTRVEIPPHY